MKDDPKEISSIMNLLLPADEQLPIQDEFMIEFFDKDGDYISIKPEKVNVLKSKFKGRVSYLKAMQSDVIKIFEGNKLGMLNYFKVVEDNMSEFQTLAYNRAYNRDTSEGGVYSFSRQAILFVYPDGTYGSSGFEQDRYMVKATNQKTIGGKKQKLLKYKLGPDLIKELSGENDEEILNKLERYSSKYAATIRNILEAEQENKLSFVYCEFVRGSGSILFASILELFGFSKATGLETSQKKRYALITNATATQKGIKSIINRFNDIDNQHGKIINVIIGSRVIGEGFSLKNVQSENILTPHWNYSETAQAIARGWRLGSHKNLLDSGLIPTVQIYQRVSTFQNPNEYPSIDLERYEISEIKDINIKKVERLMKESSFDCALNFKRNFIPGFDFERECDYMDCEYKCDGISTDLISRQLTDEELDYSTYELYFATIQVQEIISKIIILFRNQFQINLNTLIDSFTNYTYFEIMTAMHTLINESYQIINMYGLPSYVKEENNIFFLVDSLSANNNFLTTYYTKNPTLKKQIIFSKIINDIYSKILPDIIRKICRSNTMTELQELMNKLPIEIQEFFIEQSIIAEQLNVNHNAEIRSRILEYFKNYYKDFNGVWISWLLLEDMDTLRCLKDSKWGECEKEYVDILEQEKTKQKSTLETNPYGYYGMYNRNSKEFCIRDVSNDIKLKDQRKIPSGKRCSNWDRSVLTKMSIDVMKLDIPDTYMQNLSREELLNETQKLKYLRVIYPESRYSDLSDDDLRRGIYWAKQKIKTLCTELQTWFSDNNLMEENLKCGSR
jgi:hypothetical protein